MTGGLSWALVTMRAPPLLCLILSALSVSP